MAKEVRWKNQGEPLIFAIVGLHEFKHVFDELRIYDFHLPLMMVIQWKD
jgi:hypothetical protein